MKLYYNNLNNKRKNSVLKQYTAPMFSLDSLTYCLCAMDNDNVVLIESELECREFVIILNEVFSLSSLNMIFSTPPSTVIVQGDRF